MRFHVFGAIISSPPRGVTIAEKLRLKLTPIAERVYSELGALGRR
jgi:hypothetical protein